MTARIVCPHCESDFNVNDTVLGKDLRCKNCKEVFTAKVAGGNGASKTRVAAGKPEGSRSKVELADDEDDRPRRRRGEDEDEEDDRKGRKGRDGDKKKKKGMPLALIIGIAVGALLLLGGGVVAVVLMMGGEDPDIAEIRRTQGDQAAEEAKAVKELAKQMAAQMGQDPNKIQMPDPKKLLGPDKLPIGPLTNKPEIKTPAEALEFLKGTDRGDKGRAIAYLNKTEPGGPEQAEIAKTLDGLRGVKEFYNAETAMIKWATAAQVPALIQIVEGAVGPGSGNRALAMQVLAKMQDERGIDAIVVRLGDFFDHDSALKALDLYGDKARTGLIRNAFPKSDRARGDIQNILTKLNVPPAEIVPQAQKDLGSAEKEVKNAAADWLSKAPVVADKQADVATALIGLLMDPDVRQNAVRALQTWATKDNVPGLVEMWNQPNSPRNELRQIFARLKDERGAAAVVMQFTDFGQRGGAFDALRQMGPEVASKALLPYMNHPDGGIHGPTRKQLQDWSVKPEELLTQTLKDVQDPTQNKRHVALDYLATLTPVDDQRGPVVKAIDPLMMDKDRGTLDRATRVLLAWAGKDEVPTLVKLVIQDDSPHRVAAMKSIARFKDVKEAQLALVTRLLVGGDWRLASELLKKMGPAAEMSVWEVFKQVQNKNAWNEACHILRDIGTKKSIPVLTRMVATDPKNRGLLEAANFAAAAIKSR